MPQNGKPSVQAKSGVKRQNEATPNKGKMKAQILDFSKVSVVLNQSIRDSMDMEGEETEATQQNVTASILDDCTNQMAMVLSAILVPVITVAVERSVTSSLDENVNKQTSGRLDKVENQVRLLKYETDKLEQYSRKDNVKIFNIVEPIEESEQNTVDEVLKVCREIDANVKKEDIAACHRIGHYAGSNPW